MKTKSLFFLLVVLLSAMTLVVPSRAAQHATSSQQADSITVGEYIVFLRANNSKDFDGIYSDALESQIVWTSEAGQDNYEIAAGVNDDDLMLGLTSFEVAAYSEWSGTDLKAKASPLMMFGGDIIDGPGEEKKSYPNTGSHGENSRLTQSTAGTSFTKTERAAGPLRIKETADSRDSNILPDTVASETGENITPINEENRELALRWDNLSSADRITLVNEYWSKACEADNNAQLAHDSDMAAVTDDEKVQLFAESIKKRIAAGQAWDKVITIYKKGQESPPYWITSQWTVELGQAEDARNKQYSLALWAKACKDDRAAQSTFNNAETAVGDERVQHLYRGIQQKNSAKQAWNMVIKACEKSRDDVSEPKDFSPFSLYYIFAAATVAGPRIVWWNEQIRIATRNQSQLLDTQKIIKLKQTASECEVKQKAVSPLLSPNIHWSWYYARLGLLRAAAQEYKAIEAEAIGEIVKTALLRTASQKNESTLPSFEKAVEAHNKLSIYEGDGHYYHGISLQHTATAFEAKANKKDLAANLWEQAANITESASTHFFNASRQPFQNERFRLFDEGTTLVKRAEQIADQAEKATSTTDDSEVNRQLISHPEPILRENSLRVMDREEKEEKEHEHREGWHQALENFEEFTESLHEIIEFFEIFAHKH